MYDYVYIVKCKIEIFKCDLKYFFCFINKEIVNVVKSVREFIEVIMKDENYYEIYERRVEVCFLNYLDIYWVESKVDYFL